MSWFQISSLSRDETRVRFMLASGETPIGWRLRTKHGHALYRIVLKQNKTLDLPRHAEPCLWQPIDFDIWPDHLPESAIPSLERPVNDCQVSPDVPLEPDFVHGLRLGETGAPPQTIEECEERLLLGIRTMNSPGVVRRERLGYGSAWPPVLVEWADLIARSEDKSDLRAARAPWAPTRRDLGDWDSAVGWLRGCNPDDWPLFEMRAANPRYSWRQIAETSDTAIEAVKRYYRQALEGVFRESRRIGEHPQLTALKQRNRDARRDAA